MKRVGRTIALATQLGLTMGLTGAGLVLLGLLAGRWADAQFNTRPFATIFLTIAGAIAGQMAVYRLVKRSVANLSGDDRRTFDFANTLSALGLAFRTLGLMVLPTLAGIAAGLWIDHEANTGIAATLVLALLGLVLGFVGSLYIARSWGIESDDEGDDACPEK